MNIPSPLSEDAGYITTAPNETTYTDLSVAIFSMHITCVPKFDCANVENWQGGAQNILIFPSFSVALTVAIHPCALLRNGSGRTPFVCYARVREREARGGGCVVRRLFRSTEKGRGSKGGAVRTFGRHPNISPMTRTDPA